MGAVRIVHLSDLHFTRAKNHSVWQEVARFINEDVCPDAILVTGDVTDNASTEEFKEAVRSLGMLRVSKPKAGEPAYYIVPGNHDRYAWGNRMWFLSNRRWGNKQLLFGKYFADGQMLTSDHAADLKLGDPYQKWAVRVVGLDSNHAHWFAQGAIEETEALKASRSALGGDGESDLVIVLVHHHVLPIPALERKRSAGGSIAQVLNVTGMLNSGVLLHHLSKSQVNLVLHGHEHAAHQAVFRDAAPDAAPTVVLAAGSGTGEETLSGWALERVQFNVLELKPDRTVQLRLVRYDTGLRMDEGQVLLSPIDIRRARFVRRYRRTLNTRGLPSSRLKKLVIIGLDRSASIVETSTNFLVGEEWSLATGNASGFVDDAEITFEWGETGEETVESPFVLDPSDSEAYVCGVPSPAGRENPLMKRITARWRWNGAVVLSQPELEDLPPSALTGLRTEGREFIGLTIDPTDEFESAALTLHLPEEYAPARDDLTVFYEDTQTSPGHLQPSVELTENLEFCGPAHVELRIAYPLPGLRYYISWRLPEGDGRVSQVEQIGAKIRSHAAKLFGGAESEIRGSLTEAQVRIGLYGRPANRSLVLDRLAGHNTAPAQLNLNDPRGRVQAALWAATIIPKRDPGNDLLGDESLLIFLPIRSQWADAARAPALFRITLLKGSPLDWDQQGPMPPDLERFLERAILAAQGFARAAGTL